MCASDLGGWAWKASLRTCAYPFSPWASFVVGVSWKWGAGRCAGFLLLLFPDSASAWSPECLRTRQRVDEAGSSSDEASGSDSEGE